MTADPPATPGDADRLAALALLEPFSTRLLPAMVRRALARRGRGDRAVADLLLDLRQELRLDCLMHPGRVLQLPSRERHRRWFQLAERWLYRQRLRDEEPGDLEPPAPSDPAELEPTAANLRRLLPGAEPEVLERLARGAAQHGNGRCHVARTAAALGLPGRRVRRLWERAAEHLGYGEDFLTFWRHRLAEALVGLAADLLRDGGQLRLQPRPRARPDPHGRVRRIRRIHAVLRVRPLPPDVRAACGPLLRRADPTAAAPGWLLEQAAALAPNWAAVPLWQFEACVVAGTLPPAAAALRRARTLGADHAAVSLARARLLEARGRASAARYLLARAATRLGEPALHGIAAALA